MLQVTVKATKADNGLFVFRGAASADELEALLRLRYRVFRGTSLARLIRENPAELDLDCWDLRAMHFGLFRVEDGAETPVGYLRVAEDRFTSHTELARVVAGRRPVLKARAEQIPPCAFPLMSYFPDAQVVDRLYRRALGRGETLVEASRLVVDPSVQSLRLSRHVIESAVATYFLHFRSDQAMWCCDSSRIAFYRLFGFEQLVGTAVGDFLGIGERSCCVLGSRTSVPQSAVERMTLMVKAYADTGEICYHPQDPQRFTRDDAPQWQDIAPAAAC